MTCLSAGAACQLEDTTAKLREPGMQVTYCVLVFIFFSRDLLVLLSVAVQSNITLLTSSLMCLSSSYSGFLLYLLVLDPPLSTSCVLMYVSGHQRNTTGVCLEVRATVCVHAHRLTLGWQF